jgi:hypothetical protein
LIFQFSAAEMGNASENFDIEDLMSYGDDLINLLNVKNGFDIISQSSEQFKALNFACHEDFNQIQGSIEGQFCFSDLVL